MSGLYSTSRWVKRRAHQLRHEPLCRMCQAAGIITAATIADHVVRHNYDPHLFHTGELQSLCKWHHDSVKQSEEKLGYAKGADANGRPIDPSHPWNRGLA